MKLSANRGDWMLTERQVQILITIIEEFVRSAEPVGSRTLSKMSHIPYSSATIRNEMADLEDLGYLEKTHTSSGRIPSEKGYRFYVDYLNENRDYETTGIELTPINDLFQNKTIEREETIKEAVRVLSDLTNYTSIALGPSANLNKIKKFQFVPLDENSGVLILVTDKGQVVNKNIYLPKHINVKELERVIVLMNETLVDSVVEDIERKLNYELKPVFSQFIDYHEKLVDSIVHSLSAIVNERYYLSGKNNIFQQPEFQDIDKLQQILSALENTEVLQFIQGNENGLQVRIGHENRIEAMKNCTVITVPYELEDGGKGAIAVVGPTRMEYSKVIPLLEYIAKNLSKLYK